MDWTLVLQALDIMWKGMLAIFVVIAIIFGVVMLLGIKRKQKPEPETPQNPENPESLER